jgi:hypothetical protein
MKWLLLLVAVILRPINCQFPSFSPSAAPCDNAPTIVGYDTITELNSDMQLELDNIIGTGTPSPEPYVLILCPQTTFDTSVEALLPILNGATFICGTTGAVSQECIFSGGNEQVRIRDPDGLDIFNAINIIGVTFTNFVEVSVSAGATAPAQASFLNCIWQVRCSISSCAIFQTSFNPNPSALFHTVIGF